MAEDAADIVARWRGLKPQHAPREDVLKVLEGCFPGEYRARTGGSHLWIVESLALEVAQELGRTGKFPGGTLSISESGGRTVKRWLLDRIIEAIDLKEEVERELSGMDLKAVLARLRSEKRRNG